VHPLIILALLVFLGKGIAVLSDYAKIPPVVGMILLGLLLGPTGLGLVEPGDISMELLRQRLTAIHGTGGTEGLMELLPGQVSYEIIRFLALIGVVILLFIAGLETDLRVLSRAGKTASVVAVGGIVVPFALGFGVSLLFFPGNFSRALVLGTILTATSVSISVMSLMALKRIQSKEGTTILTAAIIDDVAGIVVLSVVLAVIAGDRFSLLLSLGMIVGYLAVAILVGWFLIPLIMNLSRRMNVSMSVNAVALSLMFLFAGAAEISRVAAITGAYLAGLFIGRTQVRNTVREGIETIGHTLFIPIFFIFIGIQIDFGQGQLDLLFALSFVAVAIVGKIAGSGIAAWLGGFSPKKAFAIGAGMVPRGEVALVIASLGMQYPGALDASGFTATVVLVMVSSLVTPILLARAYRQKETANA
jgi:Kef-type K+ transport system membrane component KefB